MGIMIGEIGIGQERRDFFRKVEETCRTGGLQVFS